MVMRIVCNRAPALVLAAAIAGACWLPASAQEGYPLKGTWIGTWKSNAVHGDDLFLVMDWDGKTISGTINPGTDDMPITKASLDPNGWVVHIEAAAKDKSGKPLHYVIERSSTSSSLIGPSSVLGRAKRVTAPSTSAGNSRDGRGSTDEID